jgi:hypothetical protein
MTIGTSVFPTSFAQRRLWFVHQLEPDSPSYNVTTAFSMSGELDVAALERALETVVARHEALRTTFRVSDGEPVQVIAPESPLELPLVDRSGVALDVREGEVAALIQEEVRRPLDLERGPLFRARLIRLAPDEHVLVLVVHHIVYDGWSAGVLSRELGECYRASPAARCRDCRSCPCSTPISRSGSGSGSRVSRSSDSSRIGGSSWPARRRFWSCRPTSPVRELAAVGEPRSGSCFRGNCSMGSWR